MLILDEHFMPYIAKKDGKHPVSTAMEVHGIRNQDCGFLNLNNPIPYLYKKSIIERTMCT